MKSSYIFRMLIDLQYTDVDVLDVDQLIIRMDNFYETCTYT